MAVTAVAKTVLTRNAIVTLVHRWIPVIPARYQANTATVTPIITILAVSSLENPSIVTTVEDVIKRLAYVFFDFSHHAIQPDSLFGQLSVGACRGAATDIVS